MVARPRDPDRNNVAITVKVSDNAAAAIDTARGELTRSEWARGVILAALGSPIAATGERVPAARAEAPRKARPRKTVTEAAGEAESSPPVAADLFPAPRMPRSRG